MQVQREHNQVRSARIRCDSSPGSLNSIHSRGKSRETSRCGTCRGYETNSVPPMRLGVLDVGSNTVHLLVVDAHRGAHPTPMHDDRSVLRLAEHVGEDGMLSKAGEKALLKAVQSACAQAEEQGCDELLAMVTSAIREAVNGLEV